MSELAAPDPRAVAAGRAGGARVASTPRRVLAISPFSPLPQDAGQRRRVHQMLELLQGLGWPVSLLLCPFEGAWQWRYQDDVVAALRALYDDVMIVPAPQRVGLPPLEGDHHSLDEWWDDLLAAYLARLFQVQHFDVVIINNVWLSKALALVPPRTVKVIDMHDVFHLREAAYVSDGITPEFFRIRKDDEVFGLSRSDVCISISRLEAIYLSNIMPATRIVYLPYAPPAAIEGARHRDYQYRHEDRVVFGFLGTSHTFNIAGVAALLEALCHQISLSFAPIELVFAGTICEAIGRFADRIRMTRLGWVADEADFYDRVDFFVVPVFHGSGFKVKVADIFERRKPALFSAYAVEGLAASPSLAVPDAAAMAQAMADIAFGRPPLARYAALIDDSRRELAGNVDRGVRSLVAAIDQLRVECVLDLRDQPPERLALALLSAVGLARELEGIAAVRIAVDEVPPWLAAAARYLPPAVGVERAAASADLSQRRPNRVLWRFGGPQEPPAGHGRWVVDLRFSDEVDIDVAVDEAVIAPSQINALAGSAAIRWFCVPYLTEAVRWDPVARMILAACEAAGGGGVPLGLDPGGDEIILLVDREYARNGVLQIRERLGGRIVVVDVRDGIATGRLLAGLLRIANGSGGARVIDGCGGHSPLRHLVAEMAVLCEIPLSTAAFGPYERIAGPLRQEWRARKVQEDRSIFLRLAGEIAALRGNR